MHQDGINLYKLWMESAQNLSVEILYQKLKVNFIYRFKHNIHQNQTYIFLSYFLGLLRSAVIA